MRVLAIFILALAAGCSFEIPEKRFRCDADHPCPPGQECVAGLCELPGDGPQTCSPLDEPDGVNVVESSLEIGGSVIYECDEDFVLIGDETRTCMADLTWSGTEPVCLGLCDPDVPRPVCDSIVPREGCLSHTGEWGESRTYQLAHLSIPAPGTGIGFNLDCYHTSAAEDPIGCMMIDEVDGVDNQFAANVSGLQGSFGFSLDDNYAAAILDGESGSIRLLLHVEGWNGASDDDCVLVVLEVWSNEAQTWWPAAMEAGVIEGGALKVDIEELPFPVPFDEEAAMLFVATLHGARFEAYISEDGLWEGQLGGHFRFEDGSETDLSSMAFLLVDMAGGGIPYDLVRNLLEDSLDLHSPGQSESLCDCDAMSVGAFVEAQRIY